MKKILVLLAVMMGVAFVTAMAAEVKKADGKAQKQEMKARKPAAKAEATVEGLVAVEKEGDAVKQITVGDGEAKVCICTTEGQGAKLADLAGKKVTVTGTIEEKAGKKVVKVTKFEEVKDVAK